METDHKEMHTGAKRLAVGVWVLVGSFLLGPPAPEPPAPEPSVDRYAYRTERYEYWQVHMGMQVRLVLYAASDSAARGAARAAFQEIAALEKVFSSYQSGSELMRLCRQPDGRAVHVSGALFTVLQQAQELVRRSEGAFDVTVGPFAPWREARKAGELPDAQALRRADVRVGWQHVRLDTAAQTVTLLEPGMQLNLGGIAKGYILGRALAVLSACGIERALVEAGGDLVVSAPPPGREGWRVELPHVGPDGASRVLTLAHAAVATSGDTQQFAMIGGTRYSHVIDPRTGLGVTSRTLTTVVAPSGMLADGLATALGVLGAEEGELLLEVHYPQVQAFIRKAPNPEAVP